MSQQRIEYIDLAKGFCILMVVWYHMSKGYSITILFEHFFKAFRMPLYFFLSGCFFKPYSGFWDFTRRKINKILIPFVFFYFITSCFWPYCEHYVLGWDVSMLPVESFFKAPFFEAFPNVPIWFLLCLFEVSILFYLLFSFSKVFRKHSSFVLVLCSIIIGFIGVSLGVHKINLLLYIDSAFSAIPFYTLGFYVFRKTNLLKPNKLDKYLTLLIIIAFALIIPLAAHFSFMNNTFTRESAITVYPCGILGIYGIIMLAKKIHYLPIVSYLGRYSIMVLVSHILVYHIYAHLLNFIGIPKDYQFFINLPLTIVSYLFIIPIMKKYLPYVTAQKDLLS